MMLIIPQFYLKIFGVVLILEVSQGDASNEYHNKYFTKKEGNTTTIQNEWIGIIKFIAQGNIPLFLVENADIFF